MDESSGTLSRTIRLDGSVRCPGTARAFLEGLCRGAGVPCAYGEIALLLTSEVVTNAVRYAPGSSQLTVDITPALVRVGVVDQSPERPPVVEELNARADGGRGMRLVDALASRWGADRLGRTHKRVWFELDRR